MKRLKTTQNEPNYLAKPAKFECSHPNYGETTQNTPIYGKTQNNKVLANAMHSGRWPDLGDFNIMDVLISLICFKIHSNPKVGLSTRMHCIYEP